jgi:hypothetical protein
MTVSLAEGRDGTGQRLAGIRQDPTWRDAVLDIRLNRGDGTLVAEARAPLKDWQLAQSVASAKLWHGTLRNLRLKSGTAYRITLLLSGLRDGQHSPPLRLLVEGGGNELP